MKNELKFIIDLISEINKKNESKLVDSVGLEELYENVYSEIGNDFLKWDKAVEILKEIDLESEGFEKTEQFKNGIALLGMSLVDISNNLLETNEVLIEMIQNIRKDSN